MTEDEVFARIGKNSTSFTVSLDFMEQTPSTNGNSCSSSGTGWRLPLLLAIVLATIFLMRSRGIREGNSPTESRAGVDTPPPVRKEIAINVDTPNEKAVSLSIDFGDGNERHFERLAWHEGMTVGDLMLEMSQATEDLHFEKQGGGEMTMLVKLDGVANEGAGGRNWIYSVNGERADRSYAIYPLRAGDRVLWEFTGP